MNSDHAYRDWRRVPRYLAADLTWMRWCIARGEYDLALLALRVTRAYLAVDLLHLRLALGGAPPRT